MKDQLQEALYCVWLILQARECNGFGAVMGELDAQVELQMVVECG